MTRGLIRILLTVIILAVAARAETPIPGSVPRFDMAPTAVNLRRPAQPFTYFDKAGRRFALLGFESGSFEAWAYPLKLLRSFEFSFLIGSSTVPIAGRDIVRSVSVDPAVTTLTFTYQSFTVRAHYVTAAAEPGGVILLEVDAAEPLSVVCSFLPVLQPMWPAGIGGQYAYWDDQLKAYLISEPTGTNHGYVGSPAGRGISYTPAHMLSDAPSQFEIDIPDPNAAEGVYIPVVLAGGKGKRDDVRAIYRKIVADPEACYRESEDHFHKLLASTLRVRTPDSRLDLAFEWAKVALDGLVVENPDLGTGLVAGLGPSGTGGRPGFGWYFGTDAYLNAMSLNGYGAFGTTREALAFTAKWQRRDGKMAHELSQAAAYVDWWNAYPYGYIHGDTTPYYIVAVDDYVRWSGDLPFLKTAWPTLVRAYAWCLSTDEDGDGLMDNSMAGLGALEFGSLTGIRTDIYLAAVWARAAGAMSRMAGWMGDAKLAAAAGQKAATAAAAFDEKFWDEVHGQYSYAFNRDGRLVQELTPWSAVALAWGQGRPERGAATLARMNQADLATDWGTRMLSIKSPLFEPLNYNYGAVWPFLTGWVSTALLKYGFSLQGSELLAASAEHTFDNALGCVTELFSGFENIWPQEGVPHQGFSTTGIVLPLVRGLLGLDADLPGHEVRFEPCLPADWDRVSLSNWTIGAGSCSIEYTRSASAASLSVRSSGAAGMRLRFSPALAPGTEVKAATLNGTPLVFKENVSPSAQSVRPSMVIPLTGADTVELSLNRVPEVILPGTASRTGDVNQGLKFVRSAWIEGLLRLTMEGLAGRTYVLVLRNADLVASAAGGEFNGDRLTVVFPPGRPGEFSRREVTLRLKN